LSLALMHLILQIKGRRLFLFFCGTVCLTVLSPVGYGLYEFLSVSNSSEIFLLLYVLEVMIIKAAVGDH
jgi:uncharacterized protein YhhL (DUF1145 family)